ncbi:HD domain-containing protein, partial [Porticoccaceae bacterium]|nr:HD domain-containing protein [Porticoccaceae bacterium]
HIKDIRASTIRQIRLHRNLINDEFRADPINRKLFMRLLRAPYMLSLQLQRMNRYGILGSYLPEFGKIVGQTQHDLFHIYPVDVHTLQVVRNIRRMARPEVAEQFPVAAHIFKNLPKPELIIIAALYHDIAKGRGGDHSVLGSVDIADFAERHGLQSQEIKLLQWLVENHLLMSTVSQREDISDPDVIYKFAKHCGDLMHLELLYVLTVADVNATNPQLWTDWKGSLMRNLYFETKRALQQGLGVPVDKSVWVDYAKTAALRILADEAITEQQALAAWSDVDQEFFLRERAEDIASFTQSIIANQHPGTPVVVLRDVGVEIPVATQVFVHATDRQNIFAIIAAVLDQLQLNIQDARLHTTSDNRAFDVFYILDDENRPIGTDTNLCTLVADSLKQAIMDPSAVKFDISRRTSRQLKNFTLKTQTSLSNDTETNTTVLEVITPDRPGLLAHLASIFLRFGLNLYNAKISTLGERVEDTFYLTDFSHKPLTDEAFGQKLQQTICSELDARNSEDT